MSYFSHFINQDNYRIFLVDSLGALTSCIFLLLLSQFESIFGIPSNILYGLAAIAACLCFYSASCFLSKPKQWSSFLRILAYLNILYSGISFFALYFWFDTIAIYGVLYLLGEKIIVIGLVWVEWQRSV
ncbi:MAG: hypothetical protein MH321_00905 [Leptospiraceae bacterium]|nr:hypothetical protein [Leptospiraceae bacterium]